MADAARRAPPRAAANAPPSLLPRRAAAIALGILLYMAAQPFTPVSWFTQSDWVTALDGPNIADRVASPVLLLGAVILHWYVAGAMQPVPLTLTVPDTSGAAPQANQQFPINTVVLGLWLPEYFWAWVALEGGVLWALTYGGFVVSELMRRSALMGVIFSVWVLGWNAMPWYRKEQAWSLMKDYVVRMVLMEMADRAFGGGRRRRRRM